VTTRRQKAEGRKQKAGSLVCAAVLGLCLLMAYPAHAASIINAGEVELTREGKASIQLALQFLAARQRADGSFSGDMGQTSAIVASAVLAWMAAGNLPGEGPYGRNVAKGVDFLLNSAQPSGLLFKGQSGQVMYHHGLAAIALAEAWGQTRDKRVYEKLKNAVELIVRTQNDKGGWRYQPKAQDDDLSVTVMQLLALRAAKDAGIAVPKETIDRAISYVERCRSGDGPKTGFSYQPGQDRKWSTTAAGVMSLLLCGTHKASALQAPLAYLMQTRESSSDRDGWFVYGNYYASHAMYRAGQDEKFRDYWVKWYPNISKAIFKLQRTNGTERGMFDGDQPALWRTGMCALILSIPYRYLPIYQR
jgi:prenyltransferase beta subunit